MANRINCPNGHVLAITAEHEGKKIKCPKCQVVFEVPLSSALQAGTPSAPPKPPALPRRGDDEDDRPRRKGRDREDDEDDDDRPRRRGRDRDDDDDDDRPRRKGRDRDDDEDDDDRPRRKSRDNDDDDEDRPRRRSRRDDDDDDDRDDKAKKKRTKAQKNAFGVGLTLYFSRYLTMAIGGAIAVFAVVLMLMGSLAGSMGIIGFGGILMMLSSAAMLLVAPILGVIGGAFVLRAPSKSGCAGLGIASLVLDAVILLCLILYIITIGFTIGAVRRDPFGGPPPSFGLMIVYVIVIGLCFLGGFIVNMIMFRLAALFVKDKSSAGEAITWLIVYLSVGIGGGLVVFLLMPMILFRAGMAGAIINFALMMGYWVTLTIVLFRIAFMIRNIRSQL